jgi:hypothetical protein
MRETGPGEDKKASKYPRCQRKTKSGLEKSLANPWRKSKVKKKTHAGRGQESKWEIPVYRSALLGDGYNRIIDENTFMKRFLRFSLLLMS